MRISLTITQISPGELHVKGGDNIAGEDDIDQQTDRPLPGGAGDDVFFAEKKSHHHNEKDADLQVQHGGEGAIPVASFYRILTITV